MNILLTSSRVFQFVDVMYFISVLGTNDLSKADVPLNNKQTDVT